MFLKELIELAEAKKPGYGIYTGRDSIHILTDSGFSRAQISWLESIRQTFERLKSSNKMTHVDADTGMHLIDDLLALVNGK